MQPKRASRNRKLRFLRNLICCFDFIEKTPEISEENKKLILGENAKKFYAFADIPAPKKVRNMVED